MSIVLSQPLGQLWNESEWAHNEVDRYLQHIATRGPTGQFGGAYPPVNVWDDDESISLEAELPGVTLEHLIITVTDGNQLTLKGQRMPVETGKTTWHRQERGFGSFNRTLTLPGLVDSDRVEARFELGVLHVKLPKSPKAKPRHIEVKQS
jgi:HSP20 family protein